MTPLDTLDAPTSSASAPNQTEKNGLCGICPAGCWATLTMEGDRMVDVRAQENSPNGVLCKLGGKSPDIVYSEHRLQYPMRRVGPKGTFEFERITWDQAYELMVDKLQSLKETYGPEQAAIYTGRGSFELSMCDIYQPKEAAISSASSVLFPYGSPNTLGVGALCYVSFAMIAPNTTLGEFMHTMTSDLENAETIVVWGGNPATDSPPTDFHRLLKAKERGARIIVIDPRRSETVKGTRAEWVPIRPGTDGALALGMINVMIEEELYDAEFVEKWTLGFDELSNYVQHFRPEIVEEITGVPAAKVSSLAREIAQSSGAAPLMYTGLEYSDSGVQAIRAVLTLWAIAGQMDRPGGRNILMKQNAFPINRGSLLENPDVKKALGRDRFPIYTHFRGESHAISLPEAVLNSNPYKIRSLIVLGASISTSWPNPQMWRDTFNALDFMVCIDRQLTADAAYADLVLPATTMYEITSYMTYGPMFKIREKMVDPVGEARNDYLIMAELAERLGYGHLFPQSEEAVIRHALEGSGYTLEDVKANGGSVTVPTVMMEYKKWEKGLLRPDGQPGFNTPSGKFEIASSMLEEYGYNPLPVYTEPGEGPLSRPDLATTFPLVFNSGARIFEDFRSQHHGIPSLAKDAREPRCTLHPDDAAKRGITNGDEVLVVTPRGKVRFKARVTEDIIPGAIECNMGGGGPIGPDAWKDCNVNDLTDLHRYDPISGFPVYKALLCDVVKVASGEDTDEGLAYANSLLSTLETSSEPAVPLRHVYFDWNATTPMDPEVFDAMEPFLRQHHGNPSSIHKGGTLVRDAVEGARRCIAKTLNCTARRLIFTGGGSEADNLAIKGVAFARQHVGKHIITTTVEHPAVLQTARAMENYGFEVTYLPVDRKGRVSPDDLAKALRPDTVLVSIMWANNEVGTIQPIAELARVTHENSSAFFHSDAVNAYGKIPVDVQESGVDLLSLSAHKVCGPKGIGVLYMGKDVTLDPLIHGGQQENKLRAGTENVAGIVGFGKAASLAERSLNTSTDKIRALRDRLQVSLLEIMPEAFVNGDLEHRLPNTLNLILPEMRGESVVLDLDRRGIAMSSGSACKSGSPDPTHVLLAMGLSNDEAHCSIRLSLGRSSTEDDVDYFVSCFQDMVKNATETVRFSTCR